MELLSTIEENQDMLSDPEMKELAQVETDECQKEKTILKEELTPKDPNDPKNIILEVRSEAGEDEAGIFTGDLMRMYFRYAEKIDFEIEILNKNESGGISEVVAEISGKNVYKWFKYESGVHRVQRIPKTESQERIHTYCRATGIKNTGVHPDTSSRFGRLGIVRDTRGWAFLLELGSINNDLETVKTNGVKGILAGLRAILGKAEDLPFVDVDRSHPYFSAAD